MKYLFFFLNILVVVQAFVSYKIKFTFNSLCTNNYIYFTVIGKYLTIRLISGKCLFWSAFKVLNYSDKIKKNIRSIFQLQNWIYIRTILLNIADELNIVYSRHFYLNEAIDWLTFNAHDKQYFSYIVAYDEMWKEYFLNKSLTNYLSGKHYVASDFGMTRFSSWVLNYIVKNMTMKYWFKKLNFAWRQDKTTNDNF